VVKVLPKEFDPEKDLKVKVTIDEDTEIETATLFYRKDGKGTWKQLSLTLDGEVYTCKVPKGDLSGADEMEYYIEATDTTGFTGTLGSETDVETMSSSGESPGFGVVVAIAAVITAVICSDRRRRT
jgi:PGF-CTERM protein